jgi:hypothetical protein
MLTSLDTVDSLVDFPLWGEPKNSCLWVIVHSFLGDTVNKEHCCKEHGCSLTCHFVFQGFRFTPFLFLASLCSLKLDILTHVTSIAGEGSPTMAYVLSICYFSFP